MSLTESILLVICFFLYLLASLAGILKKALLFLWAKLSKNLPAHS